MNVADKIAEFLHEKDIAHVFGIIGAGNAALFDAIHRRGRTEIVCTHHEQAAVMSATYYARQRGRTAFALCTTGAGSSNAITGALAAHMDSIPLIIISGNEPAKYLFGLQTRIAGVQGFWTAESVKRFVKHARTMDASRIRQGGLEIAWTDSLSARPGPIWLDIPRDQFNAVV